MSRFSLLVTAAAFGTAEEPPACRILAAGGELFFPPRPGPLPTDELTPLLAQADAVVAATDPYTEGVLAECPRLRVIVRWGTGYDAVDLAACTGRGILACNAPGFNVDAVADATVGAMLALGRHLVRQSEVMRSGGWQEIRGVELAGKTVGLVGYGAIGRAVAERLRGFRCRLLAADPALSDSGAPKGVESVAIEDLFEQSDWVSLHASLSPATRGLVSRDLLARMRQSAFFVNMARGALVDEPALVEALESGRIAGAALDTYQEEPLPADHPFRRLPNCLALPHSAFNTHEASHATNDVVVEQVLAALGGEPPRFLLNPEVLERSACRLRLAPLL